MSMSLFEGSAISSTGSCRAGATYLTRCLLGSPALPICSAEKERVASSGQEEESELWPGKPFQRLGLENCPVLGHKAQGLSRESL